MKSIRFVDFEVLIKEILMLDKNISLEKLNLFEIGLNSLQTMRIVNRLKQMGIVISFAELMEKPYIEKWWEILSERMSLEDALSSKILISKESNSLTDVQYAYWIGRGEKQILGGVSCHAYFEFKGLGLDTDKLKEAWYKIQQRHPMLRARFLENGTQQIIEQNKFSNELIIYDLREKQSEIEEHLLKIRTTNSHRVFDIEKGHVRNHRIEELDCIYGISLGASIAIEIALRDCIRINKLILDGGQFESMGIMKKIDAYFMAKEFQKVIQKKRMWSYVSKQMGYRNGNEIEVLYPLCCKRIQFDTLYDAALAAYGYDIKKRMEKLRMKVVIMYGGNELFAAKSVSLVKEKCVSECEVYAYDNMGHSEVLSLHPEKLCEIIRK